MVNPAGECEPILYAPDTQQFARSQNNYKTSRESGMNRPRGQGQS